MSDSPWGAGEISATIKGGKGFEEPWLVFRGPDAASVRKQVEETTGLSGEGISLAALVHNASLHFQKIDSVGTALDAIVIPEEGEAPPAAAPEPPAAPEEDVKTSLIDELKSITTKADLTATYLKHKKEFDGNADLMAALKDRYKSEDVG